MIYILCIVYRIFIFITIIIKKLMSLSEGHKKIILYANPGKEGLYKTLGFKRMSTAMAIFQDQRHALEVGLVNET